MRKLLTSLLFLLPISLFSNDLNMEKIIKGCMEIAEKRTELKEVWKQKADYFDSVKNEKYGEKLDEAIENNDSESVTFYGELYTNQLKAENEVIRASGEWIAIGTMYLSHCGFLYSFDSVDKNTLNVELNGLKFFKKMTEAMYKNKKMGDKDYNELIKMQTKSIKELSGYLDKK